MDMTESMVLELADNLVNEEINLFKTWNCLKVNPNLLSLVYDVWNRHGRTDALHLINVAHLEQCYSL